MVICCAFLGPYIPCPRFSRILCLKVSSEGHCTDPAAQKKPKRIKVVRAATAMLSAKEPLTSALVQRDDGVSGWCVFTLVAYCNTSSWRYAFAASLFTACDLQLFRAHTIDSHWHRQGTTSETARVVMLGLRYLLPGGPLRHDYFRWLFYANGQTRAACSSGAASCGPAEVAAQCASCYTQSQTP